MPMMSILYRAVMWIALLFPWIDYLLKHKIHIYPISSIWDDIFILIVWMLVLIKLPDIMKKKELWIPFAIFSSVFFISAGINNVSIWVLQDTIRRLLLPYGILLLLSVSDIKPKELLLPLLISTIPMALLGIYQYINQVPIPPDWVDSLVDTETTRAFAIFVSPNILASFMERVEAILLGLTIGCRTKVRYIYGILLLIHLTAHVFTLSRASLLAFIIAASIGLLFINARFAIGWIAAGAISSLIIPPIRERFLGLLSPYYRYKSALGGRLFQWKVELQHWKQYPIWGSGPGTFGSITAWNLGLGGKFRIDMLYLRILGELGIIGLITFMWWLISIFMELMKSLFSIQNKSTDYYIIWGSMVGFLSFLIQSFANNHFEVIPHMVFTWAIVGIALSGNNKKQWILRQ
ncbi:hypothetical protein GM182_02135 [bacterium 3DAC]|nr:hypothetical protein GM182_02135 [bacterium 3DAC]